MDRPELRPPRSHIEGTPQAPACQHLLPLSLPGDRPGTRLTDSCMRIHHRTQLYLIVIGGYLQILGNGSTTRFPGGSATLLSLLQDLPRPPHIRRHPCRQCCASNLAIMPSPPRSWRSPPGNQSFGQHAGIETHCPAQPDDRHLAGSGQGVGVLQEKVEGLRQLLRRQRTSLSRSSGLRGPPRGTDPGQDRT